MNVIVLCIESIEYNKLYPDIKSGSYQKGIQYVITIDLYNEYKNYFQFIKNYN